MTCQKHCYETAFDSRITKTDDDLDHIDTLTNHPVLMQLEHNTKHELNIIVTTTKQSTSSVLCNSRNNTTTSSTKLNYISALSQKLQDMTFGTIPKVKKNDFYSAPNLLANLKPLQNATSVPVKLSKTQTTTEVSLPRKKYFASNRHPELDMRPSTSLGLEATTTTTLESKRKHSKPYKAAAVKQRRHKYSSTESMSTTVTSSSGGGSMESIKSSTSEGNRSTTTTDSRNSCSISSDSEDDDLVKNYLTATKLSGVNSKIHILSPISDKSMNSENAELPPPPQPTSTKDKPSRRSNPHKTLLLSFSRCEGSDSGISVQSRRGSSFKPKPRFPPLDTGQQLADGHRATTVTADVVCGTTSDSGNSIHFTELPFDMPKLRRRLRVQQQPVAERLSISQASSSQSVAETNRQTSLRPKLSLNLSAAESCGNKRGGLGLALIGLNTTTVQTAQQYTDIVNDSLPLEKQPWFHGVISRLEAETMLNALSSGSFLVRNSESSKQEYSLSLKSARGYMHMRIQETSQSDNTNVDSCHSYILGEFSRPFTTIPAMIRHFSVNSLPVRGAEHMQLLTPVIAQLL